MLKNFVHLLFYQQKSRLDLNLGADHLTHMILIILLSCV